MARWPSPHCGRFPAWKRLKSADFVRIFDLRVAVSAGPLVLFGCHRAELASGGSDSGGEAGVEPYRCAFHREGRLGLAIGRSVGNAVERNLVKRRLREVFRREREANQGLDIVIRAGAQAARTGFRELERDLKSGLRRLAKRLPC